MKDDVYFFVYVVILFREKNITSSSDFSSFSLHWKLKFLIFQQKGFSIGLFFL